MQLDKQNMDQEESSKKHPKAFQELLQHLSDVLQDLQNEMPHLRNSDTLEAVFKSALRRILRQAYEALKTPTKVRQNIGIGPAAREVENKKQKLVAKSGGRLSDGEAYRLVFSRYPDVLQRYLNEVAMTSGDR
jgi:hypothetical protein